MSEMRHQFRRRARQRRSRPAALNLVSLMDIFTILVFFLMVNSSEVEVLQTSSQIKLPDSTSKQRPENRLVISVSSDDVVVQGHRVARVADLAGSDGNLIPALQDELEHQASRRGAMPDGGFEVTIMGDHELPYWLVKKIMYTCQSEDFANISLAVNRLEGESDA